MLPIFQHTRTRTQVRVPSLVFVHRTHTYKHTPTLRPRAPTRAGVMVNLGPTAGGGARAQGFGFQGPEGDISVAGVAGGLLGAIREAVGAVTGAFVGC